jgi:hypothetical protein
LAISSLHRIFLVLNHVQVFVYIGRRMRAVMTRIATVAFRRQRCVWIYLIFHARRTQPMSGDWCIRTFCIYCFRT